MVSKPMSRYRRDDQEFDRAVAFIDATFALALALTLLATTLELDSDPAQWTDLDALYNAIGEQFLAFVVSFIIVAGYWLAHYRLFASFIAIDIKVIVVNLALLAAIVLLPFTSESAGDPAINHLPLPTALLAIDIAAVSTTFTILYVMARRRGLLRSEPTNEQFFWNTLSAIAPAVVFLASVPVAYLADPATAQLSWIALAPVNMFLGSRSARAGQPL